MASILNLRWHSLSAGVMLKGANVNFNGYKYKKNLLLAAAKSGGKCLEALESGEADLGWHTMGIQQF